MEAILLVLSLIASQSPAAPSGVEVPGAGLTERSLRQVLPPALERWEKRLGELHGACTVVDRLDYRRVPEATKAKWKSASGAALPEGEQVTGKYQIAFDISGTFFRCEVVSDSEGVIESVAGKERSKPLYKNIYCSGPRGCFTLAWKSPNSDVEVASFSTTGDKEKSRFFTMLKSALDASYTLPLAKKLSALMSDDQFKISAISPEERDGRDCVRVQFRYEQPSRKADDPKKKATNIAVSGSFLVDPKWGWALRSWEYSTPEIGRSISTEIAYTEGVEGRIYPREVVSLSDNSRKRITTFRDLSDVPAEPVRYTLTYYGLPELDKPVGNLTNNTAAYWLGGIAVATLLAAISLWYKSRSERAGGPGVGKS